MNKSESIQDLAKALCAAQSKFSDVPLNSTNPFLGNKYADLGAVIKTAKPVLTENGLSVSQMVTGDGANVGVTTILMHTSGQWIETSIALALGDEKGKSRAQVAGSVVTYLRRYSYAAILGLATEEDTDGNPQRKTTERKPKPEVDPLAKQMEAYWTGKREALINRIIAIPYYNGNKFHALRSLVNMTKGQEIRSSMTDDEVFEKISAHAHAEADKSA